MLSYLYTITSSFRSTELAASIETNRLLDRFCAPGRKRPARNRRCD
jgi:hypothetical protein